MKFKNEIKKNDRKNRDILKNLKAIEKKSKASKVKLNQFVKGYKLNKNLIINTLKYINPEIYYADHNRLEVDKDLLAFFNEFTFLKNENYNADCNDFLTYKQSRELDKVNDKERGCYSRWMCWKEIKIRNEAKKRNLKNEAEIFSRIREEMLSDYVKYLRKSKEA